MLYKKKQKNITNMAEDCMARILKHLNLQNLKTTFFQERINLVIVGKLSHKELANLGVTNSQRT